MAVNPLFMVGKIMHQRVKPSVNKFIYKVGYLYLDVDHLHGLNSWFLGYNRKSILVLQDKDYGPRDLHVSIPQSIRETLREHNITIDGKIYLLTQPRVWGYVFNPVSFYFCFNKKNILKAVLADVNNTFGQYHQYLILPSGDDFTNQAEMNKVFYVSPFLKVEGKYRFRFKVQEKRVGVWIDYYKNHEKILETYIMGTLKPLSKSSILRYFLWNPFKGLKVPILIYYQALKIWLKGVPFIKNPCNSKDTIQK